MTLFGLVIVFLLSYAFDMQNHRVAINNELDNVRNIAEEVAFHVQSHLREGASRAEGLAVAPWVKEALRQSNSKFSLLNNDQRNVEINSLDQRWRKTNNIHDPFIQHR